jgi:hypothetical protein
MRLTDRQSHDEYHDLMPDPLESGWSSCSSLSWLAFYCQLLIWLQCTRAQCEVWLLTNQFLFGPVTLILLLSTLSV